MKAKVIVLLVFLVLFAIIIIQNNENVPFTIFFWSFEIPKVILVPSLFVLGFLFGLVIALSGRRPKERQAEPAPPKPAQ